MGMYTTVKFNARLNDDGLRVVTWLHENHTAPVWSWWADAVAAFPEYPWVAAWAKVERCDFIPWGSLSGGSRLQGGNREAYWRLKDGKWSVLCALKNYEGEIATFCETVLPHMLASVCRVKHEYCEGPVVQSTKVTPIRAAAAVEETETEEPSRQVLFDFPPTTHGRG
mgnify:CR=1 FL=1